ncbi:hypothetical protein BHM03_00056401 [Ensete ventricosum]|nr:hypothetical protein BHM03_00056401 [Ensete ventricosum]
MVPTIAGYTNLQKLKIEGFFEQYSVIVLINTGSTHNFMSSKLFDPRMLNWPKLLPIVARPDCFRPPHKVEDKRVTQEMTETRIVQSCLFPATTHPYILFPGDKLLLKYYILPNSPWLLMHHFQLSGDFQDFLKDRTMMLIDLLDDDLRSTAQDHKKIEPLQWQNQNKRRIICRSQ